MIKEEFLSKINKPARYIGKEFNAIYKDFDGCRVKFALCFPDLYEVGMSNLGIRIIYSLLNSIEDVVCERFFSPDKDLEKLLRQSNQELVSLESQKRLRDFDFIGFSLSYELEYPDVLNILDLGKIPLFSCQRDNRFPLVIAGGTCVLNPEPLWEFFDFFVFGEAEEVLLEIIDLYKEYQEDFKKGKLKKQELLIKFSQIRGIYVSSFYEVSYNKDGGIKKFRPKHKKVPSCIEKRTIKDLNKSHFPKNWIVPYISIIHDRPNIEIMRGCPNTCRFCQARVQYFPFRIRAPEVILDLAKEVYSSTGYEEIALCGLSVSDYPNFGALVKELFVFFQDYKVSISLPSLKPNAYLGEVSFLIAKVRKTTLTFAPEVGSERLRDFLGKDFNLEEFFKAISLAFHNGYRHIKLYFMIGVPFEDLEDLSKTIELVYEIINLRKKITGGFAQVNISINTLIPKPHTPLQWLGMEDLKKIQYKYQYLKEKLKSKNIKLSFHNPYMSILEAILSRGDRRLSRVILKAFKKGARLISWEDNFDFKIWQKSFLESRIDQEIYLNPKQSSCTFAWDFLEPIVSKQMILQEYKNLFCL